MIFKRLAAIVLLLNLVSCDDHTTDKYFYHSNDYDGFTIVELKWDGIPLKQEIKNHWMIAKQKKQKVFIQITAQWCSPCKRLRKKTEDPLLMDAYQGTYIIRLDRDEWEKDFTEIGVKKTPMPIFWELGEDMRVTSYVLDGNYWEEITAETLAPVLKPYFSGAARKYIQK